MLVQCPAFQVEAEQISNTANSATYKMKVSRRNGYILGKAGLSIYDHEGKIVNWAFPSVSSWRWTGSTYLLDSNKGTLELGRAFWGSNPDYLAASSVEYTRTVNINRGNSRQGSTVVTIGVDSIFTGGYYNKCMGNLALYTSKVADVSNINFAVTADGKNVSNRNIYVTASFTNPESFYIGTVTHDKKELGTVTSSRTFTIPITYDMFNTTQHFTFSIKGKDGSLITNKTYSIKIEPSGVGIWYKQNNKVKEVDSVYYKNNNGEIIDVTEVWAKVGGKAIKTVK